MKFQIKVEKWNKVETNLFGSCILYNTNHKKGPYLAITITMTHQQGYTSLNSHNENNRGA